MMQKQIIKYELKDEPFNIPMKIRKKLPIQKNLFELNEPSLKKPITKDLNHQAQSQLVDPLIMDYSLIKSLVFGKIQSYLICASLIVSCIIVYNELQFVQQPINQVKSSLIVAVVPSPLSKQKQKQMTYHNISYEQYHLLLLQSFITLLLLIINAFGVYYNHKNNQIRGLTQQTYMIVIKFIILALHPNIFIPQHNNLFYLILNLRIGFIFNYLIKNSSYHDNRAFRLTQIYGIKPNQNFLFALKSLVDQMGIKQVIITYCFTVLFFSHCLFLAGMNQDQVKLFSSCFQIIVVTLPTIGYGQYAIDNSLQRIIIVLAMIVGASLNSLITLIMLKQFEMTPQQNHSYDLLHKLNLKIQMQDLSREYIIATMNDLKSSNQNNRMEKQKRKDMDNRFKDQYKFLKSRYTEICARDLNCMFQLFKEEIKDFKIKSQQTNNMIFVLLSRLCKIQQQNKRFKRPQYINLSDTK